MWLHLLAQNPSELAANELTELIRATSKFVTSDLVAAIERVAPGGGSHAVESLGADSHYMDVRYSHSFIAARWDVEDPVTSTPLRTLIFGVVLLKRRIRSLVATLKAMEPGAPAPASKAPSAPPAPSAAPAPASKAPSAPPPAPSAAPAPASKAPSAPASGPPLKAGKVSEKTKNRSAAVAFAAAAEREIPKLSTADLLYLRLEMERTLARALTRVGVGAPVTVVRRRRSRSKKRSRTPQRRIRKS